MPVFDRDDELTHPFDWELIKNGWVVLFHARAELAAAEKRLAGAGYRVVRLDAGEWSTADDLHTDLARALDFPAYYGRNVDALDDCLGDVAAGEYGWSAGDTGLVLVLDRVDAFAARQPDPLHLLLDVWARRCQYAALLGHRMLCLARSDDADLRLRPVGATPVGWNPREFMRADRVR